MRKIAVFLIAISTMLLLLHSVTPHTHHKASQTYDHSLSELNESGNLLSWLQFIFHPDLGPEHLEHFQNEGPEQIALLPDFALLAVVIAFTPVEAEPLQHKKPYLFSIQDSDLLNQSQLRGPPSLV